MSIHPTSQHKGLFGRAEQHLSGYPTRAKREGKDNSRNLKSRVLTLSHWKTTPNECEYSKFSFVSEIP